MSLQNLIKNLDEGIYKDAGKGSALAFLAEKAGEVGVVPDETYVREFLVQCGVSPNLQGFRAERFRALARKVFVLEKIFQEYKFDLRGERAPTVGKVFAMSALQIIFPIFYESQAVEGILATSLVPDLCALEIPVNSHEADHISLTYGGSGNSSRTSEGSASVAITIAGAETAAYLAKYVSSLDLTFEAARMMRIDLVGVMIRRAAGQIGIDETDALIDALLVGAGVTNADVSGTLDYDEIVKLHLAFPNGYEESDVVINDLHFRTAFELSQLADAVVGQGKDSKGRLVGALGETFHRWPSTGSSGFGTTNMLAVDRRYAAVQYTEGGVLVESDRLLNRQWEKTVISKWTGFGQLDVNAAQKLAVG